MPRPAPIALPRPVLGDYAPHVAQLAAGAWPMKCAEELRSALVFRALRDAARRLGAAYAPLAADAARIAREELRHARLCHDAGVALAATAVTHDCAPVARRLAGLAEPPRRLLGLLLIEVAVGETVSAALFAAGRRGAREPLTRTALGIILHDEIGHARFGWAALARVLPAFSGEREWLGGELRRGLADLEQSVAAPALRRLEAGEPFDPALSELGVLAPACASRSSIARSSARCCRAWSASASTARWPGPSATRSRQPRIGSGAYLRSADSVEGERVRRSIRVCSPGAAAADPRRTSPASELRADDREAEAERQTVTHAVEGRRMIASVGGEEPDIGRQDLRHQRAGGHLAEVDLLVPHLPCGSARRMKPGRVGKGREKPRERASSSRC